MAEAGKRKKDRWGLFLLIWALVLLLLGVGCCCFLYRYLDVYEKTRPEPVVDAYLAQNGAEQLMKAAQSNVQLDVTEFEDPSDLYAAYLSTVDTDRPLTYRPRTKDSSEQQLVYTVYCGNKEICTLVLSPEGTSPGFGRHRWTVSEVRSAPITDTLPSLQVAVDALADETLSLNGRPLTAQYITDNAIAIPDLNRVEAALSPKPSFVRYEVGPLYGEIRVTDGKGNTLSPVGDAEDGTLRFLASAEKQSVRIRAPEDMRVSVNGVELGTEDVASSSLGVLEGLDVYTKDAACRTNIYILDGLYAVPTVTAVDARGQSVAPVAGADNSFSFFYPNDAGTEEILRPSAEMFFNAYMDYSAHAYDATRFYNLLSCILPGTALYEYVSTSQQAMVWASGTSTEYKDLRYDHFHKVSDYCCTCTVLYSADMTATSWYEQYSYSLENAYELAFVSEGGRWYCAAMNVISAF